METASIASSSTNAGSVSRTIPPLLHADLRLHSAVSRKGRGDRRGHRPLVGRRWASVFDSPPLHQGGNSGSHDNGGSGGGIHSASVPEPSSVALLISALIMVLLAVARRRAYQWLKPRRRAST
ncbi:MAG: PEP-CTERM sorting domain-containing protein [Isosphaerales bacterium]